jgi:flagellar basal body-associated protein FliL
MNIIYNKKLEDITLFLMTESIHKKAWCLITYELAVNNKLRNALQKRDFELN